ncbi:cytidylate kinase-like family protein [Clostridium sp. AM29-11AC]|nr:cytidylate kinase-like family protein [Clostridium sp. AM29-11AC]
MKQNGLIRTAGKSRKIRRIEIMARKTVCIEREYGSNGRKIAEWLSRNTGIELYDREALIKVAEENHLVTGDGMTEDEKRHQMHREAIKFLADRGSCIFVGTCAAGVLQGRDRNINVFVKADMESKIRWAMASEKNSREEAEKKIAEMDEKRSKIRDIYSVTECGDRVDYDLIITSSRFGIEGTAELIRSCMARA